MRIHAGSKRRENKSVFSKREETEDNMCIMHKYDREI
jgi:hypothetical protein